MEDLRPIIAENISALRTEKNMTQLELAEILSYTDKAVSKWERGESIPDVITLKAIADLFGVSLDYLVCRHEPGEKRKGSHTTRNNRIFITLMSVACVWILGTSVFSLSSLLGANLWASFLICVPVSCIVLLVFNSIWGKPKLNLLIISGLLWSLLATIFVIFYVYTPYDLWVLFLIGIPSQIFISLFLGIKKPKSKSKKEIEQFITQRQKRKKSDAAEVDEAEKSE
jgi:transcriptional regulator with XRE-family HTH domain